MFHICHKLEKKEQSESEDGELHLGLKEAKFFVGGVGEQQFLHVFAIVPNGWKFMAQVDESNAVLCTMDAGDCVGILERKLSCWLWRLAVARWEVMMDSRLLHCGTANMSDSHEPTESHRVMNFCFWSNSRGGF